MAAETQARKLLNEVRAVLGLDLAGLRNLIGSTNVACLRERADELEAALLALGERQETAEPPAASSQCPLCGSDTPHGHTQEFIAVWLRGQGSTYQFKGRVLPPFEDSAVLKDLRKFCEGNPHAYGEGYALIFRARDLLEEQEAHGAIYPAPSLLSALREIQQEARRNAGNIDHIAVAWGRFLGFVEKTVRALAAHREGPATADLKGLLIDRDAILRDELRVYLDTLHIGGDNIGDIRRSLFVPWESQWNGWVRDETAHREGRPPAAAALGLEGEIRSLLLHLRDGEGDTVGKSWLIDRLNVALSAQKPMAIDHKSHGHAPASETPRPAEKCECGRALPTMCSGCIVEDYEAAFGHVVSPASETGQASAWQTMESAPKDGTKVDLWAKVWAPAFDRFEYRRFADCWWWKGDSMGNSSARWMEISNVWRPTHWRLLPLAPSEDETTRTER